MEHVVLVTFATRCGSTADTARAVAQTLRDRGVGAEVLPIKDVTSLKHYDAVVLGAALYMGRLHKDAIRFLRAQRDTLTEMPVALFVPGPVETREKDQAAAERQLDRELAKLPWLKPFACEVVGGAFDPRTLAFPWKFIPAMRKMPVQDARDWVKIRQWATGLAAWLQANQTAMREANAEPATATANLSSKPLY